MNVITIEKNAEAFYKFNVSTITRHFALAKKCPWRGAYKTTINKHLSLNARTRPLRRHTHTALRSIADHSENLQVMQVTFTHSLRSSSVLHIAIVFTLLGWMTDIVSICGSNSLRRINRDMMRMSTSEMHPEATVLPLCQKTIAVKETLSESLRKDT